MAYSMLGIFGVTMDPRYGEGWGAFYLRDESLFAWKMPLADAGLQLLSGTPAQHQESRTNGGRANGDFWLLDPHGLRTVTR